MSDKNKDVYPDLSGIFDIKEEDIPSSPLLKTAPEDRKQAPKERILTNTDGYKYLPKEEQKKQIAADKKERKMKKRKKIKTRAILILTLAVVILAAVLTLKIVSDNAKKPVVTPEKVVEDSISRSFEAKATVIRTSVSTQAVLIDNDYDVHFIEKKQKAEVTAPDGTVLTATVDMISEEKTDGKLFGRLTSALLGETPEVSVFTVTLKVDDENGVLADGDSVSAKVITKTVKNALLVPSDAICTEDGETFVWKFEPVKKYLTKQPVSVGIAADGKAEITSGLKKGDRVIVSTSCAPDALYDGIRVKTK